MRIVADYDRCEGHGLCVDQAPDVFDLDDEGDLVHHFDGTDLPSEQEAAGRRAVDSCPVAALRLA
ncbi:ferredoxin [Aeromicrobium sp. Leaf289]|uniref:ferredoxin n=1 Tax=Aeromicrobium sp. Leaf289 TaxID=1736324 RepID=UPI0006F5F767|nr:ferredoxin [Aeromicrobium sp. Leaf289]KQP75512.1 ferredoxin [Aeromicrobium sp. Leaf289]RYJ04894.1 MAG: ferredoxin [Actinomycetales bacterium]